MEQILINYTKEYDLLAVTLDGNGIHLTDEQKVAILGKLGEIVDIINH